MAKPDSFGDLDAALDGILSSPWETAPPENPAPEKPEVVAPAAPAPEPVQHDLTGRGDKSAPVAHKTEPAIPASTAIAEALGQEVPVIPLPVPDDEYHDDDDEDTPESRARLGMGALVDLASGRRSATDVAAQVGVTDAQLHSQLATALREVPPEEIAKAMGLQAAEQQLKSGAVYGAVLADLVQDMLNNRLKPEVKIDLAKMLAKIGKLEPKEDRNVGVGSGFILNISLGSTDPTPITIEAE